MNTAKKVGAAIVLTGVVLAVVIGVAGRFPAQAEGGTAAAGSAAASQQGASVPETIVDNGKPVMMVTVDGVNSEHEVQLWKDSGFSIYVPADFSLQNGAYFDPTGEESFTVTASDESVADALLSAQELLGAEVTTYSMGETAIGGISNDGRTMLQITAVETGAGSACCTLLYNATDDATRAALLTRCAFTLQAE